MSECQKSITLLELKVSLGDLKALSDDKRAAFAIISFAVNEINTILKTYQFSSHQRHAESNEIDEAIKIHKNVLLRIWNAKIFEFHTMLEFGSLTGTTNDKDLKKFAAQQRKKFSRVPGQMGFKVARELRNTAANHYSFKSAKKNLGFLDSETDCSQYFHQLRSNCFFPIGETVMFATTVFDVSGGGKNAEAFVAATNEWLNWLLDASYWVGDVHDAFLQEFVFPLLPDLQANERTFEIASVLIAEERNVRSPIFLNGKAP